MQTPSQRAKWHVAVDTWLSTKAKALLSTPPPVPLPKRGPLRALLSTTRRALPPAGSIGRQEARRAIEAGAVLALARLAHWLQQRPCNELLGCSTEASDACDWLFFTKTLCFVANNADKHDKALTASFYEQIETSGRG